LRVVLVPIRYQGDGSGRLPDTSEAQLQRYRTWLRRLYPLEELELSVRAEPLDIDYPVQTQGWAQMLQDVQALRSQDNPGFDVYYHGLIAPAATFDAFCGQGCVLGLGIVGTVADANSRVSTGIGFTGDYAASTLAHEVGHAHGREHAPCGLYGQPADPAYPYRDGSVGVPGYDISENIEVARTHSDIMSYCEPVWVSDYTFAGLGERMQALATQQPRLLVDVREVQVVVAELDGSLAWGRPLRTLPMAGGRQGEVELLDEEGYVLETRRVPMHRLGDGAGAFYYLEEKLPEKVVGLRIAGRTLRR